MSRETSKFNPETDTIKGDGFIARPGTPLSKRAKGAVGLEFRPDNEESALKEKPKSRTQKVKESLKGGAAGAVKKGAEKINSAAEFAHNTVDSTKKLAKNVQETGKQIAVNYRDIKDKAKGLKINLSEIENDTGFHKFLEKSGLNNLDWENSQDKGKIREAYINYERYDNTSKIYTELFDKKVINLGEELGSTKENIEAKLFKMANENPDELRRLEKQILKAKESEAKISESQKKIDIYRSKGGKEGLEIKVSTLQKAKSWKSFLLKTLNKDTIFGWGEEYSNAYKKAKSVYGVEDKTRMKEAIKESRKEIKNIEQAEKEKESIRKKYKKQREEVFNRNDIAKLIHGEIEKKLGEKINDIASLKNIEDVKKAQRIVVEAQREFAEGAKEANLGEMSAKDLKKYQIDLETHMETVLEEFLKKEIERTSKDNLDEQVKRHIKQAEFAGIHKKDAMKKVYEAFVKIKDKLKEKNDEKFQALSLAIVKSKMELA